MPTEITVSDPDRLQQITVVVPCFNEAEVLPSFHERLAAAMAALPYRWTVLYVDDGSIDMTLAALLGLQARSEQVAVLALSRNFGKEAAMTAGLDHAEGDAVVIIDADLQDPPEVIPELVAAWEAGADVVYAKRRTRAGDSFAKRSTAHLFYRLMVRLNRVRLPEDTGDFRLLSRRAVESLRRLREQHRFMKGLFAWIGYEQVAVLYDRAPRHAGTTKWRWWGLWNLALEGITSFTVMPLKIATYLGVVVAMGAVVYAGIIIVRTLLLGQDVPGYPSLMVVMLLLGSAQLITLGLIGEYLGRVFNEVKGRPLYLVTRYAAPRGTVARASGDLTGS